MAELITEGSKFEDVQETKDFLFSKTKLRPTIGMICGSGLGGLVDAIENKEFFPYEEIPNFPVSTVKSHAGKLVFGHLYGHVIVCLQGRFHLYEGYSVYKCTFPVRVIASLGVKTIIITNAAGGINESFNVGDIMVIKDHIGLPALCGFSPLVGKNCEKFGPRFPMLGNAYDKTLQKSFLEISECLGYKDFVRNGIYYMNCGPAFETPAELRFIRTIGGDAVGMSTVPEVIVAAHMGVKVLGISLITNKCVMDYDSEDVEHCDVVKVGRRRTNELLNIFESFMKKL